MSDSLVSKLRHLASLNDPRKGGPYGGHAAQMFIEAAEQAADTIEALTGALEEIAGSHPERVGYEQTDIDEIPDLSAWEAVKKARSALSKANPHSEKVE